MKKEVFEFICPAYFLGYIMYGDSEGLTVDEINRINNVLSGYYCFSASKKQFFTNKNDFNNFGDYCVLLTALKND